MVRTALGFQVIPTVGVNGEDGEKHRVAMLKHFSTLVDTTAAKAKFFKSKGHQTRNPAGAMPGNATSEACEACDGTAEEGAAAANTAAFDAAGGTGAASTSLSGVEVSKSRARKCSSAAEGVQRATRSRSAAPAAVPECINLIEDDDQEDGPSCSGRPQEKEQSSCSPASQPPAARALEVQAAFGELEGAAVPSGAGASASQPPQTGFERPESPPLGRAGQPAGCSSCGTAGQAARLQPAAQGAGHSESSQLEAQLLSVLGEEVTVEQARRLLQLAKNKLDLAVNLYYDGHLQKVAASSQEAVQGSPSSISPNRTNKRPAAARAAAGSKPPNKRPKTSAADAAAAAGQPSIKSFFAKPGAASAAQQQLSSKKQAVKAAGKMQPPTSSTLVQQSGSQHHGHGRLMTPTPTHANPSVIEVDADDYRCTQAGVHSQSLGLGQPLQILSSSSSDGGDALHSSGMPSTSSRPSQSIKSEKNTTASFFSGTSANAQQALALPAPYGAAGQLSSSSAGAHLQVSKSKDLAAEGSAKQQLSSANAAVARFVGAPIKPIKPAAASVAKDAVMLPLADYDPVSNIAAKKLVS